MEDKIEKLYNVNEMFVSIQGEGSMMGIMCTFIRLFGCNLSCEYCDTKKSLWRAGYESQYKTMNMKAIVEQVTDAGLVYVTITGGEPLLWDLDPLLTVLCQNPHMLVGIETNGTQSIQQLLPFAPQIALSISPKVPRESMEIDELSLQEGGFQSISLKIPYPYTQDISAQSFSSYPATWRSLHLIQRPGEATEMPLTELLSLPPMWRVGIQLHKMLHLK